MTQESCSVCSAELTPSAKFCHQCGASTVATVISFDDDTARQRSARERSPTWGSRLAVVGGLAALGALIAIVVFGGSTPGDDDAAPQTPPTASPQPTEAPERVQKAFTAPLPEPQLGEPLEWHQQLDLGSAAPLSLVEHQDRIFAFSRALELNFEASFGQTEAGLAGYVSEDGENWEALGQLIDPPASVGNVIASELGLIAAGNDADGNAAVWLSTDGAVWTHHVVAATPGEASSRWINYLASNGESIVVVGEPNWGRGSADAATAVAEVLGISQDHFNIGLGDTQVEAFGPLGLLLGSWSYGELGLETPVAVTEADQQQLAWHSVDAKTWTEVDLPGEYVFGLDATANGQYRLMAEGAPGALWRSMDGLTWEHGEDLASSYVLPLVWQDVEVMPTYDGFVYRRDPQARPATQSLKTVLPGSQAWSTGGGQATHDGLALIFWPSGVPEQSPPTRRVLVVDGHTLSSRDGAALEIQPPTGPSFSVDLWSVADDLAYTYVAESATVVFENRNSEGQQFAVSLAALEVLDAEGDGWSLSNQLAYSDDLVTWSVGSVGATGPEERAAFSVLVTPTHIVATTWGFGGTGNADVVYGVWSAPRPPR